MVRANAMPKRLSAAAFIEDIDSAMPRYISSEAAAYLALPESTIRAWFFGMPYGDSSAGQTLRPHFGACFP